MMMKIRNNENNNNNDGTNNIVIVWWRWCLVVGCAIALCLLSDLSSSLLHASSSSSASLLSQAGKSPRQQQQLRQPRRRRQLGIASRFANALIGLLTPTINSVVQRIVAANYETLSLEGVASNVPQTLPGLHDSYSCGGFDDNNNAVASSSSSSYYQLTSLKGMETMNIEQLEFVEGSLQLQLKRPDGGLFRREPRENNPNNNITNANRWSAQWHVRVGFPEDLVLSTIATSCNNNNAADKTTTTTTTLSRSMPTTATTTGSILISQVRGEAYLTVHGTTEQLVRFGSTTSVDGAHLDSLTVHIPYMYPQLGLTTTTSSGGTDGGEDGEDAKYQTTLLQQQGFHQYLMVVITDVLDREMAKWLPVPLVF